MLLSIFTNCYNSAATLERTYKSLLNQTVQSFEWILVDDCSNDDGKTTALIKHFEKIAPFPVKYKFLETNYYGSKSTYTACTIATGEYACILDHDDELQPKTIEKVVFLIEKHNTDKNFAGVCGRCIDEKGNLIGAKFPFDEKFSTESEIRFKYKNTSELFQFTKISVLKTVFAKMKRGYTNGFCWFEISQSYKYLYVNDVFRMYDTAIINSHSNTKKINKTTVDGQLEGLQVFINAQTSYFKFNIKYSLQLLYQMLVYSSLSEKGANFHLKKIAFPFNLFLVVLYPFLSFRFKKFK